MSQETLRTQRTRKVIEFLKIKRRAAKPKELREETGIPERSLFRILEELGALGLVKKREDGYWVWSEYNKPYDTPYAWEKALDHSRNLLPGFTALLEANPQLLLSYRENGIVPKGPRYEFDDAITGGLLHQRVRSYNMSEFLEEHLQTGHPQIYKNLVNFRNLTVELEKLKECEEIQFVKKMQGKHSNPDRMTMLSKNPSGLVLVPLPRNDSSKVDRFKRKVLVPVRNDPIKVNCFKRSKREIPYILGPFETKEEINSLFTAYERVFQSEKKWYVLGPVQLALKGVKGFIKTQETRIEIYGDLNKKLGKLKLRIENGQPLDGHCGLCPDINIKEKQQPKRNQNTETK